MGIESGMTAFCRRVLIAIAATAVLLQAVGLADAAAGKRRHPAKITVHPKTATHHKYRWRGYGFLPGYRQPPNLTDWRDRRAGRPEPPELRYWHDGQLLYGWGYAGYYRGRYNGGSFGPCWTYTPIGMMPTCGQ
jgi:hypothetical protein